MRILSPFVLLALCCAGPVHAGEREGFVTADDGKKLFFRVEGSGPETLVVVHGGPGNSMESVRPDFERLAKGRTVIYYDQRGNGRSDLVDDEDRVGITYQIADLDAVRRHFRIDKLTLLGNSWGGLLISAYAAAHPDRVERLILDDSAAPSIGQLQEMVEELDRRIEQRMSKADIRRLGQLMRVWHESDNPMPSCQAFYSAVLIAYSFDPQQTPAHSGELCSGSAEALRRQQLVNKAIWRSMGEFDYRPLVASVKVPVLVVHGVADVTPVAASEDWAKSFPNARLLLIQRAGHLAHLEQPDIFFGAVEQFLKGEWPAGAEDR